MMDETQRAAAEATLGEVKQEQERIMKNQEEHTQMICQ